AIVVGTARSGRATGYLFGTPGLATMTDGVVSAPWNLSQGDGSALYSPLFPTYSPGGPTAAGEPNVAVYPGATSGTDGNSPYPSGTVGTPGPLNGYCGGGNNATAAAGTPSLQPAG